MLVGYMLFYQILKLMKSVQVWKVNHTKFILFLNFL